MSHHHHHHHRDPHHKRQQNLAWFGIVMLVVILAFCGIAAWSDHSQPIAPTAPIVVNPPVGPTFPDAPPFIESPVPPDESNGISGHGVSPHRHHRHHHAGQHHAEHVSLRGTIPGYDSDGSVIAIPNPDCN